VQHPFQVIVGIRRRNEELEERKLAAILSKQRELHEEFARIRAELHRVTVGRVEQVALVCSATIHQQSAAGLSALLRRHDDVASHMKMLEDLRADQMQAYLSARRGRELIEELDRRRAEAHNDDMRVREQRRDEELFLMRRDRDRDTAHI
jgi:hypothetical protein